MLEFKRHLGKSKERLSRVKADEKQPDFRLRSNGKETNMVLPQAAPISMSGQFKGKFSPTNSIMQINENRILNPVKRSNKNLSADKNRVAAQINNLISSSVFSSLGKSIVEQQDSRMNYKIMKASPKNLNIIKENLRQFNGAQSYVPEEVDDFQKFSDEKHKAESNPLSPQNSDALIDGTNKEDIGSEVLSEYALVPQGISQNLELWDVFFDLELIGDNKSLINQFCRKYFRIIESMLSQPTRLDKIISFSNNNLYPKIIKLQVISLIFIRFIFTDFNFESTLKANLKRILNCINEPLLLIYDNAVLKSFGCEDDENFMNLCQIIDSKKAKLHKFHKPQKLLRLKDLNSLVSKAVEACINSIKQFSK